MQPQQVEQFTFVPSMKPIFLGAAEEKLYAEIISTHGGHTLAEIKEDGYRIQVHKNGEEVRAFTNTGNEYILQLYPEIATATKALPDCILDAEFVGVGIGKHGFDAIDSRFRARINPKNIQNYLDSGIVEENPLTIKVFDTLAWEGEVLLDRPLAERRVYTEAIEGKLIAPSELESFSDSEALGKKFETLVAQRYEGLVCKQSGSVYSPGVANEDWIKLKRTETLDLAILGVYLDEGKINRILCGAYDADNGTYESLAKVNARREGFNEILEELVEYVEEVPGNVILGPGVEEKLPDRFTIPEKSPVVEIRAMCVQRGGSRYACGLEGERSYSLRIGWLKQIRNDKIAIQSTTSEQVARMYAAGVSA